MSTGGRAPRRPPAENDTGINQSYMLTVPPTSSIRHSVTGSPPPSASASLPAEVTRTGVAITGPASDSDNHPEPLDELITRLRRPTSVLAPGGQLRPSNSLDHATLPASPSLVTDAQLHAQHAQSHSSTPTSNSVVQALGDAFRVPIPGYSAPASIGDSTWRTLGFDGTSEGGAGSNTGSGSGTRGQRGIRLGGAAPPSAPASPPQDDGVWTGDWIQSFVAGDHDGNTVYGRHPDHERHENADYGEGDDEGGGILVIPSLGDRSVENDVHTLLEVHGIASRLPNEGESSGDSGVRRRARQRPPIRMRAPSYRFLEEDEDDRSIENTRNVDVDAEGEVDAEVDDMNTGSSHGDYEYYPGGSSHRTRRRLGVGIRRLSYVEHFGVEEEDEPPVDDRMDVDVDMDMGGGVEEDCESEESEDEEDQNSTRTRALRQSHFTVHSSLSSRRYGTSSNAGASTSTGSAGTPSSIPFPKSNTHSGQNESQNPANNYGYGSRYGYYDDLDLAGICFDPSGERMYVAGIGGSPPDGGNGRMDIVGAGAVVEWGVGGAEKRWWVEEEGWK